MHRVTQYSVHMGYKYGGFALSYAVYTGYLHGLGQPYICMSLPALGLRTGLSGGRRALKTVEDKHDLIHTITVVAGNTDGQRK
jgi:hypothetical protein